MSLVGHVVTAHSSDYAEPDAFQRTAIPEGGICEQAYRHVQGCTHAELLRCLHCDRIDLVRAATKRVGERGNFSDTPVLARLLQHADRVVVSLAENSLWAIWLRAADDDANALLAGAIGAMNGRRYFEARQLATAAIHRSPGFAEAYHQRAIVSCLVDREFLSIADSRQALRLNPWHFAAAANLAYAYVSLGLIEQALDAYNTSLKLHPSLECVRASVKRVRAVLHSGKSPAGSSAGLLGRWGIRRACDLRD